LHDDHTQPVTAYFPKCYMLVKQQRTVEILLLAVVPWFVSVVPITAHLRWMLWLSLRCLNLNYSSQSAEVSRG